jgi:hypothetical protein
MSKCSLNFPYRKDAENKIIFKNFIGKVVIQFLMPHSCLNSFCGQWTLVGDGGPTSRVSHSILIKYLLQLYTRQRLNLREVAPNFVVGGRSAN